MVQKTKDEEQKEQELQGLDFEIPDTSAMLQRLAEAEKVALVQEHSELMSEEEKQGKDDKKKEAKRQRSGGKICHCYVEGCGIGGFVERT